MGEIAELSLFWQTFMRAYPYRRSRWTQPAPVKPLRESRVAIVTTAGLHLSHQPPFDLKIKGGDPGYRWIDRDVAAGDLLIAHRSQSFDHAGIEEDRNLCFPIDRFRELVSEGVVGSLNHRHLSFMGSITAPGRLMTQTAPEAAAALKSDEVDLAYLVPV
jgi:D-proline reductase (dithiol) PrdB